jgi:FkbM family methyltransferase
MNQPKVSIGMPVYNGEEFICQALDSLLRQTYANFELIISDNASTDSTRSICLDYAKKDRRIHFYHNVKNLGALENFQKVLELANADYFMWAAHDDLWEPSYISTLIDNMNNDENIVLSFSMLNTIDEKGTEISKYPYILEIPSNNLYRRLSNYINQHEQLGKANPIYGLMKKKYAKIAFQSTFDLMKSGVWGADMLFVFQLLTLGELAVAKEILFHKRKLSLAPSSNMPNDWYSYFIGYRYLILNSTNISEAQKKGLNAEIYERQINSNIEKLASKMLPSYLHSREYTMDYSPQLSYSQSGEDLIIKFIFDAIGIHKPRYLDIGAYHPEILSNTALFYQNGSHGINAEANPYLLNNFFAKRPKDINLNLGVGSESKKLDFYVMSTPTLSTFSQEEVKKYVTETKHTLQEIIPIQVETINQIVNQYAGGCFPELLSLDVEGLDLAILQSIDYQKSYPIVICVETISFSETGEGEKNHQVVDFLTSQGYLIYADTYINTIFVREDSWKQQGKKNQSINIQPISLQTNSKSLDPLSLTYEVDRLSTQLEAKSNQLETLIHQLEAEKEKINAIESSKFWKLRKFWFKLKNLFKNR